ncbi:MAG: nucleotidyltransferase domain-containing protein [Candidatus Bathyarchaeia archaeon]
MAALKLRDRDAIISPEGLIFRVFGYSHPSDAFICDVEYAPEKIFKSANPKALREKGQCRFYKFYEDEGWRFIKNAYPQYMIFHKALGTDVVGVRHKHVASIRKPEAALEKITEKKPKDKLIVALVDVFSLVKAHCSLSSSDFGVFGSLLHGFYHPNFSDIDLIIYGKDNLAELSEVLRGFYADEHCLLRNEFEDDKAVLRKNWHFQNYSLKEFLWHQKRKLIYALFKDAKTGRIIKTEFEPVKKWEEIGNEELFGENVMRKGWTRMVARVVGDGEAPFIPSVYEVEPLEIFEGEASEVSRIVSYMEEFRLQAFKDEEVYVEGNLEEVETSRGKICQVTLTYCPRYYEQALKVIKPRQEP